MNKKTKYTIRMDLQLYKTFSDFYEELKQNVCKCMDLCNDKDITHYQIELGFLLWDYLTKNMNPRDGEPRICGVLVHEDTLARCDEMVITIRTPYNFYYGLKAPCITFDYGAWFPPIHTSQIKKVIFNNPATIVYWYDGDKTVVKTRGEKFDPEKGLAMACVKHFLGLKEFYNMHDKAVSDAIDKEVKNARSR